MESATTRISGESAKLTAIRDLLELDRREHPSSFALVSWSLAEAFNESLMALTPDLDYRVVRTALLSSRLRIRASKRNRTKFDAVPRESLISRIDEVLAHLSPAKDAPAFN